jgi:hypothetical protein
VPDSRIAKARYWRPFLPRVEVDPGSATLTGWRRSADRTRLHANSLLIGNLTGSFAFFGPSEANSLQETAVLQRLIMQLPKQVNREKIKDNREFL